MHPLGVNIVSAVIGLVLVKGTLTVWLAHVWPAWRRRVEHVFLRDQNLFAQNAPYSGTVAFFKWWALLPGLLLVLPRFVIIDIVLVLIIILIWRYLVSRARQAFALTQ